MTTQLIVSSAFVYENGKVLVAKRADTKKFLPGLWELPGGHVEIGESVAEALVREVMEELHCAIEVGNPFFSFSYLPKEDRHAVEVDCFARLEEGQAVTLNGDDHSAFAWIKEEEIDTYFDAQDWTGKAIREGFRLLKHGFQPFTRV